MNRFIKAIDNANDWLGKKFICFLILIIVFIMSFETIMRYAFHAPTTWVSDMSWIICGIYFLIGGAYTMRHNGHINMDIIYKRFSPRIKAIIDLFTSIIFFAFCVAIIYYSVPFALRSISLRESTLPPSLLPIYFTKAAIPIGVILLALQGLSKFIKDFKIALTGESTMNTALLTGVLFACLVLGLIVGLPMAWVLGGIAVISTFFLWGQGGLSMIVYQVFGWASNTVIIAVPLFTLMGILLERSGLAESLFEMIYRWSGKIRGGLAMGVLVICVLFAAMTGVTAAATITMGIVALPAMLQRGYNKQLAVGVIAGGGTLGILIPPSVLMIVFSLITTASVGKLFAAGVIAGLIIAILLMIYVFLLCYFKPQMAPASGANYSFKEKMVSLRSVIAPIILIIAVLGSIFLGVATPTESAAIGALGALIIGLAYRKLTWQGLKESCYQTLQISGMMIWIVIGAACFVSAYTGFGAIDFIKDLIMGFEVNRWVLLSGMMVILLLLGMFLDPGGIILLTAPIFVPISTSLGFDLTYVGVLYIISMMIGFLSPPFGFNLFYMRSVCPESITMGDIYRSVLPYIGVLIIGLIIIIAFPVLTTTIPNMIVK